MYTLTVLLALVGSALAISTISAKGSKLFTEDGAQFYIKGMLALPVARRVAEHV